MIGVLVKREEDKNGENSYKLFSLKNYEEKSNEYENFRTNKDLSSKQAQEGDLLFRFVYPNKIIYVDKELEGKLIPSQFCIIRTKKEKMDPIVLKWYLESRRAEEEMKEKVTGTIIKSMTIANLKTIEIPDTKKKTQQKMKKLIQLWQKEKEISKKILEEKDKLYNSYLEEMTKQ